MKSLYEVWNSRINVISRKDVDFYTRHVLHSLSIAKVIDFVPSSTVLDVGTGGGFPRIPLAEAMCKVKAVAIMDKAESFSNSGGPLFNEARSSLYDLKDKPYAINYIYGLGGRDIRVEDFYDIYQDLFVIIEHDDPGDVYRYIGVRDSRFK